MDGTSLMPEQLCPLLVMNDARLPGAVPPFTRQRLLRPSFCRRVRSGLKNAGLRSVPVFRKAVTR